MDEPRWAFTDPPNFAVITVVQVLRHGMRADIEGVEIKRVRFVEMLGIRRKADTVPPPRSLVERMLPALFGSSARTHLNVSHMLIDRRRRNLKHWVEDGMRNAGAGVSPDPFFTVPY